MIPSPALQLTSPVAMPGAVLPGDGGEAAEGADFAALLAQSAAPAALSDAAIAGAAAVDPALNSAMPITADPAAVPIEPAAPGKILPMNLPLAALPAAPHPESPEAHQDDVPQPHDQRPAAHPLPLTALAGQSRAAALRAMAGEPAIPEEAEPEPGKSEGVTEPTSAPALPDAVPPIALAVPAWPHAATPAVPANTSETAETTDPLLNRQTMLATAAPVVRTLIDHAPPQTQPQPRPIIAPSAAPPQATATQTAAQAATPAPPPLLKVRLDVPQPEAVRPVPFETARTAPALAAVRRDEPETSPLPNAGSASVPAGFPVFSAAAPAPLDRPHDFSALIDRLAAAREAAAPQSISISLPHADFGRVQLHFRSEEGALAVSLASPDPDFARIAAQAAPPVLAVSDPRSAEHTPGQSTTRSDNQSANASQQGSQRGHSDERRSERQARLDHLPRPGSPAKGHGRSGIFA